MAEASHSNIHIALAHFPVYNKIGEIVTSSVTTLDVHDIARICRTYSVGTFYVVTPLKTQQELVERIVKHWLEGYGSRYNPTRKEALLNLSVQGRLEDVEADLRDKCDEPVYTVIPDAKRFPKSVDYGDMKKKLQEKAQFLLVFGTGWGLEKGRVERADYVLSPIEGVDEYNHLPVRAAIAIILDRLLGVR